MLPKDSVAQRSRGRTPHALRQPSDAALKLKALGGKIISPPRPEENGCVISVHHCQSQLPAQLADPLEWEASESDGRIVRSRGCAGEEREDGGLK